MTVRFCPRHLHMETGAYEQDERKFLRKYRRTNIQAVPKKDCDECRRDRHLRRMKRRRRLDN